MRWFFWVRCTIEYQRLHSMVGKGTAGSQSRHTHQKSRYLAWSGLEKELSDELLHWVWVRPGAGLEPLDLRPTVV